MVNMSEPPRQQPALESRRHVAYFRRGVCGARYGRGRLCIGIGEQLAREIHQHLNMQGTPIIVMSAYPQ